jgi:hypothetical protein
MASRPGGPMRWTVRYSIRYKNGNGMVTALPSASMLVNPTRPGLVHSEYRYANVHFHSLVVYIAMGAIPVYARRMSPRSGMVRNNGGQEG